MDEVIEAGGKPHKPKLLVVDDDPTTSELIRQWFADSVEVLASPDGLQGLQAAYDHLPDLVLLDLRMPGSWPRCVSSRSAMREIANFR